MIADDAASTEPSSSRAIGSARSSVWGRRWCHHLESCSDFGQVRGPERPRLAAAGGLPVAGEDPGRPFPRPGSARRRGQAVRAALSKRAASEGRPDEELDRAVRQIVSRAVALEGVLDIFAAAGLDRPDVPILSEEFLAEVRGMQRRNLPVELLQKVLTGELATRRRKNVVQARSFADMLEQTIRRYQNRAIEAAQVIEELIGLARELREAGARGEALGLSDDELAFYDALAVNRSAVHILGDETLIGLARELVTTVRGNVTIDWTPRENVRANLRRLVKRILRKHGYPPDTQEAPTKTVLELAEILSAGWAACPPRCQAGGSAPTCWGLQLTHRLDIDIVDDTRFGSGSSKSTVIDRWVRPLVDWTCRLLALDRCGGRRSLGGGGGIIAAQITKRGRLYK